MRILTERQDLSMGDIFGRFIAVILLAAVFTFVCIGFINVKAEEAKEAYTREVVEEFYEKISKDGQITVEEWELFQAELARSGYLYETDICIGRYGEAVGEE